MTDRLAQLESLHRAEPDDPFLTYGIALEHMKAERFDDAISWFDQTLGLDSKYCYAYFQKAKALSELGQDDDAIRVLDEGIATAAEAGDAKAQGELIELRESLSE